MGVYRGDKKGGCMDVRVTRGAFRGDKRVVLG